MKNILFFSIILLLFNCTTGYRESTIQKPDKSFIQFTGNTKDAKVIIDNGESLVLEESVDEADFDERTLYHVSPGKHTIKVYKKGKLVINRILYFGNNETKLIEVQ